ncbi:MAG: lactonase family protein [Planctomycetales bacterium]
MNGGTFVYLSIAGDQKLAVYSLNQKTGDLTHATDVKTEGGPGSLVLSLDKKYLYASLRTKQSVGSYRMNTETGNLTSIGEFPVQTNLVYVNTDRTGKFLFGAEYVSGKTIVCDLHPDGKVATPPRKALTSPINAHCLVLDPSGKFAFVPHTGPNRIDQYRFDSATGNLVPNDPPFVEGAPGSGPRHLAFHPTLSMAYSADELGSSLSVWKFHPDQGTLERLQTISTLPEGFKGENTCADVKIHPSGRFVYVSNRGHDSLACYDINGQTGLAKSLGPVCTEKTPRSFDLSPDGEYVYAAGQGSGKLASYRLNSKTGQLQPLKSYDVGPNPSWVMIVKFP